jgi:hypothetical protein
MDVRHNEMDGVLVVRDATAEPTLCYTIRPGDTASKMALRFTGSVQHSYEPWFQIVDPKVHRLIPKADYSRIHPGWRTCVPETRLNAEWRPGIVVPAAPVATAATTRLAATDPSIVLGSGAALLAVVLIAWRPTSARLKRTRSTTRVMQSFSERFISEFERPLRQPGSAERPLEARVRFARRRRRVDILLAPNGGRSYPNMTDHRKNVTYDVGRVMRLIADTRFSTGQVHARGRWVVVPCQLVTQPRQEGGK